MKKRENFSKTLNAIFLPEKKETALIWQEHLHSNKLSRIRQNNITEAQNENQTGRYSVNRYLVELENWLENQANDALDVLNDICYPAITIRRTFSYFLIFFSRKLRGYASYEQFIALS